MKLITKLKKRWQAKTPAIARFLQIILGGIGAVFTFWSTIPEEFKGTLKPAELKIIAAVGLLSVFFLQFLKTKDK